MTLASHALALRFLTCEREKKQNQNQKQNQEQEQEQEQRTNKQHGAGTVCLACGRSPRRRPLFHELCPASSRRPTIGE